MYNNMQSNPDNFLTDEELVFLFLKESESQQLSHHLPSHHQPHQPTHQPPHQQPLSQQMQQDPFNYRTQRFIESHSLLQRILIHGKRSVTEGYYENRNESPSTSSSNNQVVSRDWETTSTSSSNQVSPTIAEGNQSIATLQQPYQQQQILYEQNYINHSANYDTSMPSQPRMQAPYVQPILYNYLQQQQGTNGNNNNNFKQENRHRNINNRDRHRQLSPYDSSTSFAWINRTNANQATGTERKRTRQTYTQKQTFELEKEFHTTKYLPKLRREQLSTNIHLSERQIKIWFQNRRMKAKKTKNVLQNDSPSSTTTTTSINNSTTSVIPTQEEQILNLPRVQPIIQQFDGAYQNYFQPYQHSILSRSPEMQYHNARSPEMQYHNAI